MRLSLLLIPLLSVCASQVAAAQHSGQTPLLGQVGGTYLSKELRQKLDQDYGFHAQLGALVAEQGILGMPSLDLAVRYAPSSAGELLTVESCYSERALIGQGWWLGAGFGANWLKLMLKGADTAADDQEERQWGIGGKAMIGMLLTNRAFLEVTYHYTPKLLSTDTTSVSVGLGYWF